MPFSMLNRLSVITNNQIKIIIFDKKSNEFIQFHSKFQELRILGAVGKMNTAIMTESAILENILKKNYSIG
jgi:hypothetical protein